MQCVKCKQEKKNEEISGFFKRTKYPLCKECLKKDKALYGRGIKYLEENK